MHDASEIISRGAAGSLYLFPINNLEGKYVNTKWQICRGHRLWASSSSSFLFWSTLNWPTRWGTTHWPLLHFSLLFFIWFIVFCSSCVPFYCSPNKSAYRSSRPRRCPAYTLKNTGNWKISGVVVKQIDIKCTDMGGKRPRVADLSSVLPPNPCLMKSLQSKAHLSRHWIQ